MNQIQVIQGSDVLRIQYYSWYMYTNFVDFDYRSYPYKLSYINTYFFKNKPIIELYICDAIIIIN